jgi:GDP-mannose 6-dehydrogenase
LRVCVVGLGRMGAATAACLAHLRHQVVGVDRDPARVDALLHGGGPAVERKLAHLLREGKKAGRLSGASTLEQAASHSEIILVCVDTPVTGRGMFNVRNVVDVCRRLRPIVAKARRAPVIAIRSTLAPGTSAGTLAALYDGCRIRLCVNPDFTREGHAVSDFMEPGRIVIGVSRKSDSKPLKHLYQPLEAPIFVTGWTEAELVKVADNAFHALKITFANEIASICRAFGTNPETVMSLLRADRKLNIAEAYLKPGLPFGGPCLSKDISVLIRSARKRGVRTALLQSILRSNDSQIGTIADEIARSGVRSVGFLGLSFKAGVMDLRGSLYLELARRFRSRGIKVLCSHYDEKALIEDDASNLGADGNFATAQARRKISREADLVFSPSFGMRPRSRAR